MQENEYVFDQRAFFDEWFRQGKTFETTSWNSARKYEVASIMNNICPQTILNVGCGVGYHDLLFAEYDQVLSVLGLDYSVESIQVANQNYPHHKVQRIACDFNQYIPSRKFDLVTSFK